MATITKQDVLALFNGLNTLKGLPGVKFGYAVAKNINLLKPEVEAIDESVKPTEEFVQYDKERAELAQKHAKKDEKGEAITVNNSYEVEDKAAFTKELEKIQETYKEALAAREKQVKEHLELLKTESDVVLHKIALEDIPEQITTDQMYNIFHIIAE